MFITFGYKSKFSGVLRSLAATAIGLVMIIGNNATVTVVKIIAAFLIAAGIVSLVRGYTHKEDGALSLMVTNAVIDLCIGLVLFFFPEFTAKFIVYMIGAVLVIFGIIQLVALSGAMRLLGAGPFSLILSVLAIAGGILLLFNPFSLEIMSIIAGCLLVFYGVSEVISTWRMSKAKEAYEIKFSAEAQARAAGNNEIEISGLDDAREVEFHKE